MTGIKPFPPAPEHDPGTKLQVHYDRPVQTVDTGKPYLETLSGPYARIVIQGDARYVERIHAFLGAEIDWMWDDLARDRALAVAEERLAKP